MALYCDIRVLGVRDRTALRLTVLRPAWASDGRAPEMGEPASLHRDASHGEHVEFLPFQSVP